MPTSCCAYNCITRCRRGSGVTFHCFPFRDKDLLSKWVQAIGRDNFEPSKSTKLCSNHFEKKWFYESNGRRYLLNQAVPTIFYFEDGTSDTSKKKGPKKAFRTPECYVAKIKTEPDEYLNDLIKKRGIKRKVTDEPREENVKEPCQDSETKRTENILNSVKYEMFSEASDSFLPSECSDDIDENNSNDESLVSIQDVKRKLADSLADIKRKLTLDDLHDMNQAEIVKKQASKSHLKAHLIEEKTYGGNIVTKVETINMEKLTSPPPLPLQVKAYARGDKVTKLPDNCIHFEFAKPKRQFILKLNKCFTSPAPHKIKSETLEELLMSLLERKALSNDGYELLSAFGDLPKTLCRKKNGHPTSHLRRKYSKNAVNFATSLYLSSISAFYVASEIFHMPARPLVQRRLRVENYFPGFTQEALDILKNREYEGKADRLCTIMLNSVFIKRRRDLDTSCGRWIGHVDIGSGQDFDNAHEVPLATEVLVITVVGLLKEWKLPIGYFLHKGMSGEILKRLVEEAIFILDDCGLNVKALVCNGSTNCIKMSQLLGCNVQSRLKFSDMVTSFLHPSGESKNRIYVIFGIRHSLNLLLKLFEDKGTLQNTSYGIIDWKFLKLFFDKIGNTTPECVELQHPIHMNFYKLVRNIRLCQSKFSPMLSNAIELADEMEINDFLGCDATACFATDIHSAVDLLNSRYHLAREGKSPIRRSIMQEQVESMRDVAGRLFSLALPSGEPVAESGRWASMVLFAFTLKSVSLLTSQLMNDKSLKYFCTYRLNLDHSDMVLGHLQRKGEWDIMPSATEFRKAYKTFFDRAYGKKIHIYDFEGEDITVGQGLIFLQRDELSTSNCGTGDDLATSHFILDLNMETRKRADLIIRNVSERLECPECMSLMLDGNINDKIMNNRFQVNYLNPSAFVLRVLKISNTIFNTKLRELESTGKEYLVSNIFHEYLSLQDLDLVDVDSNHLREEPHHIIGLIKSIIRCYATLRLNENKELRNHIQLLKNS